MAQRTHPASLLVKAIGGLGKAVLPIIAAFIGTGAGSWGVVAIAGVFLAIISASTFFSWLAWRKLTYRIGAADIRVESGILNLKARSVPYDRIQDVSLEQKLLARLLGLVEVRFETGAGGKDELTLAFVTRDEGERLRELVRDRRHDLPAGSQAGLAAETVVSVQDESKPLFAMNDGRLFTFGLFEFSLAIFAILLGAAQQFDFLLPFNIWEWGNWELMLGEGGKQLGGMGRVSQMVAGITGLLGVIVVGFATGIFRTFAREYGFRLDRTERGFRRRRGLFTATDVVMPAHRVQAARIGTKWFRYRFGWHWLEFVSLAQDSKSASHTVAPFARLDEIWPILKEAGLKPPAEDADWQKQSRRAWGDSALLISVPLVLAAMGIIIFAEQPQLAAIPLLCVLGAGLTHWYGWKRHAHALDGDQIILRSGIFSPQLQLAERVKLQSVQIVQGPLAKRRGYAAVKFGLAGGTLAIDNLDLAEAVRLRDAVLDSICKVDFSQLQQSA